MCSQKERITMKTKKVLLTAPYMLMEVEKFHDFFKAHNLDVTITNVIERMSEQELLDIIEDYEGVISGDDAFTRAVLSKAKKLKVISKWGTGINTIDCKAAKEFGIKVCNTLNAFSHPVADTALAFMLDFARDVSANTDNIKNGIWEKTRCFTLGEKTLGIIGVGNVGVQVAKRANAFGMKILGNDIRPIPAVILEQYNIEMVEKNQIYEYADIITIHCDLNADTDHLLNNDTFAQMKRKPYIINTARGGHIEHNALIQALETGVISGAGLDVFENEPVPADDKLLQFDNVVLAPHNSNSSPKYWDLVHKSTLKNLIENI